MTDTLSGRVAANIKGQLARQNMTQGALAHRLGLARTNLSKRLSGRVPIDLNDLERIAEALEVDARDLLN